MNRRAFLTLPAFAVDQAIDSCELVAVERWNRFSETSARYLRMRQEGVRSLKERKRMEQQFGEVMRDECF
jgi:hypothetical protein